jgi:hypothetical protein
VDADYIIGAGQVAAAVGAILTLAGIIVKWTIVKPIKNYIDQATYQIQPDTNGGKSLSDLHNHVSEVRQLILNHIEKHKDTPF